MLSGLFIYLVYNGYMAIMLSHSSAMTGRGVKITISRNTLQPHAAHPREFITNIE